MGWRRAPGKTAIDQERCPSREPFDAVLPVGDDVVHSQPEPPGSPDPGASQARRSRWRRLDPGRQALLALARLRNGDTYARLAAGFGVGTAIVYRYVTEAIDLLAATAPDLTTAMRRVREVAFAILDGTLVLIDRIRGSKDRAHYSGKHKRHGSTRRCSPTPRVVSSGPHQRCQAPPTIWPPPAPTASWPP